MANTHADADVSGTVCQQCHGPTERRCSACGICLYCSDACEAAACAQCDARVACALHTGLAREKTNLGECAMHVRMFPKYDAGLTAKSEAPDIWDGLTTGAMALSAHAGRRVAERDVPQDVLWHRLRAVPRLLRGGRRGALSALKRAPRCRRRKRSSPTWARWRSRWVTARARAPSSSRGASPTRATCCTLTHSLLHTRRASGWCTAR